MMTSSLNNPVIRAEFLELKSQVRRNVDLYQEPIIIRTVTDSRSYSTAPSVSKTMEDKPAKTWRDTITEITMWKERWFLSSNAKDIGTLYLMFALFSGLIGTAFSVLIRLELSGPGVQYIADNQLYNSIITAHAIGLFK